MRFYIIICFFICLFLGCESQAYDSREDWIKEIQKAVNEYEKKAKVEITKVNSESGNKSDVEFYERDLNGLQKIKTYYLNEEISADFSIELFVLNNEIILERWTGLMPLLYKGEKKETDPCCELFSRIIYFKNSSEGNVYIKQLKIVDKENLKINKSNIEIQPFVKEDKFDIQNEYQRIISYYKGIKEMN